MRRRDFLGSSCALAAAWPFAARAEQAKIRRVGFVSIGSPDHESPISGGLKKGLAERGYALGGDLVFDERYAEGQVGRFPALIAELLASGVDVLVPLGNAATLLAQRATATVPIVCFGDDLVGLGLAISLARPGGNVTGVDADAADYRAKWLELLKTAAPNLRLIAVLSNPETPAIMQLKEAEPRFGLTVSSLSSRPPDLESSLSSVAAGRFDGLIVADNPSLWPQVPRIVALVAESRTPTLYGFARAAGLGGLMGYSVNFFAARRRMADCVDKILKGAPPGDLPLEHPTQFTLAINLKTAKTLGIEIPPLMLASADEVIE